MFKTTLSLYSLQLKSGLTSIHSKVKQIPLARFKSICQNLDIGNQKKMKIHVLPALKDNFMYIIADTETKEAAVIDPIHPQLVICIVKENNYNLTKILTTHHHWDHAGGNKKLASMIPDLIVYGGDHRVEALTCTVKHGSIVKIGCLDVECLFTPCHTTGHMCYFVTKQCAEPVVFTGDTLFIGGCGRFFEGAAVNMYHALYEVLGKLPDETKVYCGHEYTVNNLKFGLHVEPCNNEIKKKLEWACCQVQNDLHTVPSTIGEEKLTNPFMRLCCPEVQLHTKLTDPIEIMACLRDEKDDF